MFSVPNPNPSRQDQGHSCNKRMRIKSASLQSTVSNNANQNATSLFPSVSGFIARHLRSKVAVTGGYRPNGYSIPLST